MENHQASASGFSKQGIVKIENVKIKDHLLDLMNLKGIDGTRN